MRSSKIFSPSFVLPPGKENGLRPSSALRASKLKAKKPKQVSDCLRLEYHRIGAGLETCGLRASSALRIASFATRAVSSLPTSK